MNYLLDLIIVAMISLISYSNYKRGFSKLLIGVVIIIVSLLGLLKFHNGLYSFFGKFFSNELHIQIASFIFIFIILLSLSALIGKLFKVLPEEITNVFERIFSAIAGFGKGIVYTGLILVVAAHFIKPIKLAVDESLFGSKLSAFIKEGIELLSKVAK